MDLLAGKYLIFIRTLISQELIAVQDSLQDRIGIILFMPFGNGFHEVPADMCKAAASSVLYFGVALYNLQEGLNADENSPHGQYPGQLQKVHH